MVNQESRYRPEGFDNDNLLSLDDLLELRKQRKVKNLTMVLDTHTGLTDTIVNIFRANNISTDVFRYNYTLNKLSIFMLLKESLSLLGRHRMSFIKIATIPLILYIVSQLKLVVIFGIVAPENPYIIDFIGAIAKTAFVLFMVTQTFAIFSIHKVALEHTFPKTIFSLYVLDRPILKYILFSLIIGVIVGVITVILTWLYTKIAIAVVSNIDFSLSETGLNRLIVLMLIPCLYFLVRIILSLPAIVENKSASLIHAWFISRGNGWRLVFLFSLLPVLLTLLLLEVMVPMYIYYFMDDKVFLTLFNTLWYVLTYFALILEITIISLAYKRLNEHYPKLTG